MSFIFEFKFKSVFCYLPVGQFPVVFTVVQKNSPDLKEILWSTLQLTKQIKSFLHVFFFTQIEPYSYLKDFFIYFYRFFKDLVVFVGHWIFTLFYLWIVVHEIQLGLLKDVFRFPEVSIGVGHDFLC